MDGGQQHPDVIGLADELVGGRGPDQLLQGALARGGEHEAPAPCCFAPTRLLEVRPVAGAWRCTCGNTPADAGFIPCDARGEPLRRHRGSRATGFVLCVHCHCIVDAARAEAVGWREDE